MKSKSLCLLLFLSFYRLTDAQVFEAENLMSYGFFGMHEDSSKSSALDSLVLGRLSNLENKVIMFEMTSTTFGKSEPEIGRKFRFKDLDEIEFYRMSGLSDCTHCVSIYENLFVNSRTGDIYFFQDGLDLFNKIFGGEISRNYNPEDLTKFAVLYIHTSLWPYGMNILADSLALVSIFENGVYGYLKNKNIFESKLVEIDSPQLIDSIDVKFDTDHYTIALNILDKKNKVAEKWIIHAYKDSLVVVDRKQIGTADISELWRKYVEEHSE